MDKRIGEQHGDLRIVAPSTKPANGYMKYYWCLCACGNYKRLRYDYVRKNNNCGMCDDFIESGVLKVVNGNGNE